MRALNFNQFIYEVESGDKFFTFLGDYVNTDYARPAVPGSGIRNHIQRYRNRKDNRFLNVLEFIYKSGSRGRAASEISNLLKSWGLSGSGNILYATEWPYYEGEDGSRRTGLLRAHCTKKESGRWVLSDNKLKRFFAIKEAIEEGRSQEEVDRILTMFDMGLDPTERVDDPEDFLKGIDI